MENILNLIKKYRVVFVFIIFIIASGIAGFFMDRESKEKETVVPNEVAEGETSEGIKPGKTTVSDLEKIQGLREVRENADGTSTYYFGIETDPNPTEIIVRNNLVLMVKKRPTEGEPTFISEVDLIYDEPDLTLFADIVDSLAYVYLEEGFLAIADKDTGVIHQLRYFVPSTEEEFLASWGKDLSEEAPTPPPLYY